MLLLCRGSVWIGTNTRSDTRPERKYETVHDQWQNAGLFSRLSKRRILEIRRRFSSSFFSLSHCRQQKAGRKVGGASLPIASLLNCSSLASPLESSLSLPYSLPLSVPGWCFNLNADDEETISIRIQSREEISEILGIREREKGGRRV